jgi:aquaporin Z
MATKKAASPVKKSTAKKPTKTTRSAKSSTVKAVATSKSTMMFKSPFLNMPVGAALVAEFIGTFLFAGAVIAGQGQPIIILFALAGIVLLVGALSGAHLNPAITIGAFVTRKITGLRAIGYIVAQFLGALTALGALNAFVGGAVQTAGYPAATLYEAATIPAGKEWYIFFAEVLGTAILGFAIATVLKYKADRVAAGLTAGFGIFVALLLAASAAAYVGGTAIINPAVALSLNALKWELWPLAAYVLAPVIGAVIGFVVQDILQVESDKA